MSNGPLKKSSAIWLLVGVLGCGVVAFFWLRSVASAKVDSGSEEQRLASVRKIAATRPPAARAALAKAARSDKSARVRRTALISLSQMARPEDREVFEQAVQDDDETVRAVAADTLGSYNDAEATAVLVRIVENDRSRRARMGALRGLARCEDPRAIVCLLNTAELDRDPEIQRQAMQSLMRKFGANIRVMRDPRNGPLWRDLIQRWKWDQRIRDAFAAAGARLVDHKEHILGRDWHPERRED